MTTQEEKELREQWMKFGAGMDLNMGEELEIVADYWIDKRKSHDAEMVRRVKELPDTYDGEESAVFKTTKAEVLALFTPKGN